MHALQAIFYATIFAIQYSCSLINYVHGTQLDSIYLTKQPNFVIQFFL